MIAVMAQAVQQLSLVMNQNGKTRTLALAILMSFLSACVSSGRVETLQSDSDQPIVDQPKGFISPLLELQRVRKQVEKYEDRIRWGKQSKSARSELVGWQQAYDTLESDQEEEERQLARTGEATLYPGRSYSFELESYCVNARVARPVTGDGLRLAPLKGPAESWIFELLKNQAQKKVSQERIQFLIWALLEDVRFDELSDSNQETLLTFYPDARTRFGNRRLENLGQSILSGIVPDSISEAERMIQQQRDQVLRFQSDYNKLSELLSPLSDRKTPIPVGWMKMNEGYFLKITADGFQRVHIDIYVPPVVGREPSSIVTFRPWEWVGLPSQGQRLAISTKSFRKPSALPKTRCEELRVWKPKKCHALTDQERAAILEKADPNHFPNTRYQSPSGPGTKIEEETDCSRFVHEVYHRAGIDFEDSSTVTFDCLNVFQQIDEENAKQGDLILYRGHVEILDNDGLVISATRGGKGLRSTKQVNDPDFVSSITRLKKEQAGNGPWKVLRWRCP